MSGTTIGSTTALPAAVWRKVNDICNRFEAAWKNAGTTGLPPDVVNYLEDAAEPLYGAALAQLVLLDADYRRERREEPPLAEYQSRFPKLDHGWLARALAEPADQSHDQRDPAERTHAAGTPDGNTEKSRYRIIRRHAGGGLGEVFVAEDSQLKREVALKEIKGENAANPAYRGRFMLEAEITGGLEHPGIVPVYSLDNHQDGRPFYAMRLIQGYDFKQAIDDFYKPENSGGDPGERRVAFQQLLRRFLDICNAVAYAHSRGVLHRDLKPANVMLGGYGETLVVDWGLAKPVGSARLAVGTEARKEGNKDQAFWPSAAQAVVTSQAGVAAGTPAYMSPEQAEGKIDQLGPTTDVYSLGATLYHLLTGTIPFAGSDDVLQAVHNGSLTPPRQVRKEVPPALEAICLKAMKLRPEDRYRTARGLAVDVEHWLADEPVSAYREPWRERTRRWLRRHRTMATSAAAVLVAAVVLLTGAAVFLNAAWEGERVARWEVEKQREAAEESERQAIEARNEAEGVAEFLVDMIRRPDPGLDGREVKVVDVLDLATKRLDKHFESSPRIQSRFAEALGQTYFGLGMYARSVNLLENARDLRASAFGPNDRLTLHTQNLLARSYGFTNRLPDGVQLLERIVGFYRANEGVDNREAIRAINNLAQAYLQAGKHLDALGLAEEAFQLSSHKFGADHRAANDAMNTLGMVYLQTDRYSEAFAMLNQALEWRRSRLGDDHPDTLLTMTNAAGAYRTAGRVINSLNMFDEILKLRKSRLGPDHPLTLRSMSNLAVAYLYAGRPTDALPVCDECARLTEAKLGPEHRDTLTALNNLAGVYRELGRLDDAAPLWEKILSLLKKNLGPEHPDTLTAMNSLAANYQLRGRLADAASLFEETLTIRRRIVPDTVQLSQTLSCLGSCLLQQKQDSAAEGHLREALAILEQKAPNDWTRFWVQKLLGTALTGQGKHSEAEPFFLASYDGLKGLGKTLPASAKRELPDIVERLVLLYTALGKPDKADEWRAKREQARPASDRSPPKQQRP